MPGATRADPTVGSKEDSMTEQTRAGLKELQRLDEEIRAARDFLAGFDPLLAEVEDPALRLEAEVERTRSRLQEMRLEERRLDSSTREKRTRIEKLTDRLNLVRNVREESAVNTELDMVRSALEADERETLSVLDQIRKFELRLEEETSEWEQARAEVEPKQKELLQKREEAQTGLASMQSERDAFAASIPQEELRVYEAIHSGGRRQALAVLTEDGACGACFSMIPLQLQQEIRTGTSLIRCEACGVILAAQSEEEREAEAKAAAEAAAKLEAEAAEQVEAEADGGADDEGAEETDGETPEA